MKRLLAFFMILALLITGLCGCKSPVEEESAAAGEYVETDTPDDTEQDVPTVVDPNEEPEVKEEEYVPGEEEEEEETPSPAPEEETPGEEEEETPSADPAPEEEEEPQITYKEGNLLKIVDYNVRCADDGPNKMVDERAPRLQKLIEELDPDLMGFQEVTPKWWGLLDSYFSGEYDYAYKERQKNGECTPIFWKKDKFEKLDEGHFWLSDTPDVESKGWDADYYRICTWVRLKVKATGTVFLYFNSHWDGTDTCHIGSSKLTLSRARQQGAFEKYAMFLTADFNMLPWSKGYQSLVESGELSDVNYDLENDQSITTNGYNESNGGRIIDMCFYSPAKAAPISYRVLNEQIDGGYISDHRGLLIEVALL